MRDARMFLYIESLQFSDQEISNGTHKGLVISGDEISKN